MRVLLLGPYPPPHGGVQTNLVAIREHLLRRGHWCGVINLHRHRTGRGKDVYHPASAPATMRLLLGLRYDIAHLHLGGELTPRLLGLTAFIAARPGPRSVLSFHSGGYATSPAGRTAHPRTLRGFAFRRFDRIIAVNPEIAALFERFGVEKHRVRLILPHVLPAGADADLPPRLQQFFCDHSPVLITVGLLEPEYDLELQIDALGDIRRAFPRAGLILAGAGSLEADLGRRIAAVPWGEHVLLAGDVPHPVTLRAIAEADVFLRTTHYDGDSVAVREALHLGTPVIATDNGMRPDGVLLIPPRDKRALVGQVAGLPANGRRPPAATDESNIEAVLDLYQELLRP
jgi:glycogen(starch) synthase